MMHQSVTPTKTLISPAEGGDLMGRVVTILDQARANVLRAVNSNRVLAFWLIGRKPAGASSACSAYAASDCSYDY